MYLSPQYKSPTYSNPSTPSYPRQVSSFTPSGTARQSYGQQQQAQITQHKHKDYRDQTPESKEQHSRLHRSFTPTAQDKTLEPTTPSKKIYQQGSPAYRTSIPPSQSSYQTSTPNRQPYHQLPSQTSQFHQQPDSHFKRSQGHPLARSCDNFKPLMQGVLPPIPTNKKYTLVLDLDETLIHCFDILSTKLNFYTRPKCHDFLQEVSQDFDLVIFTAASKEYADPIINHLDKDNLIKHRLFRESMTPYQGLYVKDLTVLGRDMGKTILVDNLANNFAAQPMNGYLIKDFLGLKNDDEFEELLVILRTIIQRQADVRDILPIRSSIIQQYRADQQYQKQQQQQNLRQSVLLQQQKQKEQEQQQKQQKLRESMRLQEEKQKQERLLVEKLKQKEAEEKRKREQKQKEEAQKIKQQQQKEEAEKIKQQQLKLQELRQQQLQKQQQREEERKKREEEIERKKKEELERKKREIEAERQKQLKIQQEREKKQKEEIERKKKEIEAERQKQKQLQQIYEQQQQEQQKKEDIKRQNLIASVIEQIKMEQRMKLTMASKLNDIQKAEREQEQQDNQQIKKLLLNMKQNEQQLLETQSQNNFSNQNTVDNTPQNESVEETISNHSNNNNNFKIGEQQITSSVTDLDTVDNNNSNQISPKKSVQKKQKKKIFDDIFTNSNDKQTQPNPISLSTYSAKNNYSTFGAPQRNTMFSTPKGRDVKSSQNLFFTPVTGQKNNNNNVPQLGNFSSNSYQVSSLFNSVDNGSSLQNQQRFSQNPYSYANISGQPMTLQNLNLSVNLGSPSSRKY